MGGATFSYGHSCGCTKAEILAINDDGECHGAQVIIRLSFAHKPNAQIAALMNCTRWLSVCFLCALTFLF